jgi:hypothetical protein
MQLTMTKADLNNMQNISDLAAALNQSDYNPDADQFIDTLNDLRRQADILLASVTTQL